MHSDMFAVHILKGVNNDRNQKPTHTCKYGSLSVRVQMQKLVKWGMNRAVYAERTAEYYFQISHRLLKLNSLKASKVYREKDSVINLLHAY